MPLLIKETYVAPFLQYVIYVSCVLRMWLSFSSKYPTDHVLYNFENAYFEWKQKHAVFVHVSLNANELLLPPPFPEEGCAFTAHSDKKKKLCLILNIMSIVLKTCILKPYQFNLTINGFLSAHIRSTHTKLNEY